MGWSSRKKKEGMFIPFILSEQNFLTFVCMFLSCHVRVSEWIPHSIVAWMSRNSLLEAVAKSEGEVTATGLEPRAT